MAPSKQETADGKKQISAEETLQNSEVNENKQARSTFSLFADFTLLIQKSTELQTGENYAVFTFRTTIASWLRHCTKNLMARTGRILSSRSSRDRNPMLMCSNFQGLKYIYIKKKKLKPDTK